MTTATRSAAPVESALVVLRVWVGAWILVAVVAGGVAVNRFHIATSLYDDRAGTVPVLIWHNLTGSLHAGFVALVAFAVAVVPVLVRALWRSPRRR